VIITITGPNGYSHTYPVRTAGPKGGIPEHLVIPKGAPFGAYTITVTGTNASGGDVTLTGSLHVVKKPHPKKKH
jgi:hypothetical protein